jgi:PEP-CTERM motif
MIIKYGKTLISAALLLFASSQANALIIGVYSENAAAETGVSAAITGQGHTFVNLSNLAAGSLGSLDIAWYMNNSNGAQGQAGNAAAISSFVSGGGIFLMHDRRVTAAQTVLPGAGGISFVSSFADDQNINVINAGTSLTNGPGGIISNATLDGGNSSNHGYALAGTLPATAVQILSTGNPSQIVDFTYMFGAGSVHYSTIPLDFYADGGGSNGASFRNIYIPNLISYASELAGAERVPAPATLALLGLGLGLIGVSKRRKNA